MAGTAAAFGAIWAAYRWGASHFIAGQCGSVAETFGFYGVILGLEWRRAGRPTLRSLRSLLVEFGPAELIDTFVTRPLLLAAGPALFDDVSTGVVVGKVAADVLFYAFVMPSRRLHDRLTGRPGPVSLSDRPEPESGETEVGHLGSGAR
ncbi:hypothetical protein [Actinoplanes sp. NPDC089786]|uniref:hypothetical protein n=1 Tax=Actinoplanes sp. NPDC089786 TaxID=3155185 RepID=UPI00342B0D61